MAKKSIYPTHDIAVTRQVICGFFTPPLPRSTFFDKVKEGLIVRVPKCKGFYYLNASRLRLGFPEADIETFQQDHSGDLQDKQGSGSIVVSRGMRKMITALTMTEPLLLSFYPNGITTDIMLPDEFESYGTILELLDRQISEDDPLDVRLSFLGGFLHGYQVQEEEDLENGVSDTFERFVRKLSQSDLNEIVARIHAAELKLDPSQSENGEIPGRPARQCDGLRCRICQTCFPRRKNPRRARRP